MLARIEKPMAMMDSWKEGETDTKELSESEMRKDIERLIGWYDAYAESLSNSAHFDVKQDVYGLRKKYGIKTPTFVRFSKMFGGRMTVEDAIKRKLLKGE